MRMPFGRYEGQTLEEIADADLDYLRWLLRQEVGPDELRAEAARLLEARTLTTRRQLPWRGALPPWAWGLAGVVFGAVTMVIVAQLLPAGPASPQPMTTADRRAQTAETIPAVGGQRPVVATAASPALGGQPSAVVTQGSPADVTTPRPAAEWTAMPTPRTQVALTPAGTTCEARQEGVLAPGEVADHIGEYRSVQFRVMRTHNSGKAVFLNSRDPWQGHFEVVIFPDRWGEFSQPPEELFLNRCVVVYGKLQLYKGTPEIVLQSADHIRTVE